MLVEGKVLVIASPVSNSKMLPTQAVVFQDYFKGVQHMEKCHALGKSLGNFERSSLWCRALERMRDPEEEGLNFSN